MDDKTKQKIIEVEIAVLCGYRHDNYGSFVSNFSLHRKDPATQFDFWRKVKREKQPRVVELLDRWEEIDDRLRVRHERACAGKAKERAAMLDRIKKSNSDLAFAYLVLEDAAAAKMAVPVKSAHNNLQELQRENDALKAELDKFDRCCGV